MLSLLKIVLKDSCCVSFFPSCFNKIFRLQIIVGLMNKLVYLVNGSKEDTGSPKTFS